MKGSINILIAGMFIFIFSACSHDPKRQYLDLVKSELASGRRSDSIFFGIYLGMPAKDFFTHCWEMNKKGIFTDGKSNTAVLYRLNKNELKYPASMTFYPEMDHDRISKMTATIQYDGWAPWNKHMFADSLVTDVMQLFKKWYSSGNPFIKMTDPEKNTFYVKVDGNRRITISKKNDMEIKVNYTDMLKEKPVKQ